MTMRTVGSLLVVLLLVFLYMDTATAWSGNYETIRRAYTTRVSYCACWYRWWGCSYYRRYWRTYYRTEYRCKVGWTHNGNQNCNIPICRPKCLNGGTCTSPNYCNCPDWSTGAYTGCSELTCSYKKPCYPGDCGEQSVCTCEPGFLKKSDTDGCTKFDPKHEELRPVVAKSNVTLSHIRRVDNYVDFMFILEGTNTTDELDIIWSNQKRFNNLRFEYETLFTPQENLPDRPNYVHTAAIGIVNSFIEANVSKIPRDGGLIRDYGSFKAYQCDSGFNRESPALETAICVIDDDQFKTLIEHGDWLNIKFKSDSGGFQKLVNTDQSSKPYATKYYEGLQDVKEVQFNFDFIAPKHCSEPNAFNGCPTSPSILRVEQEFTKNPIKPYWKGWTDDLAGMWEYYVEIFKLSPDPYDRLTEATPVSPEYRTTVPHSSSIQYPEYTPKEPGMYSVLMEARDMANNSRIARRFVLYDDQSEISLNEDDDGKMFVSSAIAETGYKWQTRPPEGNDIHFSVDWANHFINRIHEDNKLLNEILAYPVQFADIKDDALLFSTKYVNASLDDNEGKRTRSSIKNFHGIVKFEIVTEFTLDETEPTSGWKEITPLAESTTFTYKLDDGDRVRVWIRANDIMGNTKTDNVFVKVDGTPPTLSKANDSDHKFVPNVNDGKYNYSSRIQFNAADDESGVHKLGFEVTIHTTGKDDRVVYKGFQAASTGQLGNPLCDEIEGICFIPTQKLELDNCWFMTSKTELDSSSATVLVTVYNQALLTTQTTFEIGAVNNLKGLEKYNGPENIRIESPTSNGFRVAWDLPEKSSCYGRAEIVIALLKKNSQGNVELETFYTYGTSRYFDILGLDPETEYMIDFGIKTPNASAVQQADVSLSVKTPGEEKKASNTGMVVGVAVGCLVVVAIVIIIVVVLIRKGVIKPAEKAQSIKRTVTRKVRRTMYGEVPDEPIAKSSATKVSRPKKPSAYAYDNRQSELYIYGGMDIDTPQVWHIDRNDITFETLIKSGHFANIYKAKLRNKGKRETVVAKTLKENFTADDELLMKAKINFTGQQVGDHPNILKFIGAVVSSDAMGPFIIYEYCEHGTLKDYLTENKTNLTIELQENLFRFGLDIAKGMEYLAGKGIVHRRLAARNILLTFVNEVKISGFGPQPAEDEDGDAEQGQRERIPIKWMAPECMSSTKDATEKSDVWSFAVVLWEIFSLGDSPYSGMRSRDIPTRLKKGERLKKPEQCDDTWFAVMTKCWEYDAKRRPKFSEIRNELDSLFVAAPGDDYYYYKR